MDVIVGVNPHKASHTAVTVGDGEVGLLLVQQLLLEQDVVDVPVEQGRPQRRTVDRADGTAAPATV